MRHICFLFFMLAAVFTGAVSLPDNIYFRAMQDEMQRTKKQLHIDGNVRPLYIAYKIQRRYTQSFQAVLGTVTTVPFMPQDMANAPAEVTVYMYSGDKNHNSSGFTTGDVESGYARSKNSYEALRWTLWSLSDEEYIKTSKRADQKAAVKREKQIQGQEPEFSTAPKAHFVQTIEPFQPRSAQVYDALLQELSAQANSCSYLEDYSIEVRFQQLDKYFLDSEGDFYQLTVPENTVSFMAKLRNRDGYLINITNRFLVPADEQQIPDFIREKAALFLKQLQMRYSAVKADVYAGPVLFMPSLGISHLLVTLLDNLDQTKPLMSLNGWDESSSFVQKRGKRVMSAVVDVFDRPQVKQFQGKNLPSFMPVDEEGVVAQELHLIENGKLKDIPTVRSLLKGQTQSNGHARMDFSLRYEGYPIAQLSSVFLEPKHPLPYKALEQKLLELCREQELEYCYIVYDDNFFGLAERIYTADGHKQAVYGIQTELDKNAHHLRDIVAAGQDREITLFHNGSTQKVIISPALLVREVDLVTTNRPPDRKPFVPHP